jgi:hypothetical protein
LHKIELVKPVIDLEGCLCRYQATDIPRLMLLVAPLILMLLVTLLCPYAWWS